MHVNLRVYSHVPSKLPLFLPFKNGPNAFLWCCSYITLKNVKEIKGAADKNGDFEGKCEQGLISFACKCQSVNIAYLIHKWYTSIHFRFLCNITF